MTVDEWLRWGRAQLEASGLGATADQDARWLMADALAVSRDRLILHLRDTLNEAAQARFEKAIERRRAGRSVAVIVGWQEFYGRRFNVSEAVLDPRPDTETLIDLALATPFTRVLDLGTGSGCILLTLLAETPDARGIGTDISPDALAAAERNAANLGLRDRCQLHASSWFDTVTGTFDLIVSNPPYLTEDEFQDTSNLSPNHSDAGDPRLALSPGGDGLDAYRQIAAGVAAHLKPGGRILVEIGEHQAAAVVALFTAAGLEDVTVHPDINGKDRVIAARHPSLSGH